MIDCKITFPQPLTHLIELELHFSISPQDTFDLILPSWRPGRYELAPFVENIQRFNVSDPEGNTLNWQKTRPNKWTIDTQDNKNIKVSYQYYANKMDAGNSVLDDYQVYINFINCIFFSASHLDEVIQLQIDLPENYQLACSLKQINPSRLEAKNYYELVDSPLLASASLKILNYTVDKYKFSLAVLGDSPLTDEAMIHDFEKFTQCQITTMGNFPTQEYIFMTQSLDYTHYHGVEHQNSTVLVLGPNDEENKKAYYEKLMGVASHELFHTWNVTRIRPKEMSPYQFESETMTRTGFVTEGFTTYYGDLFLKQSGVFDQEAYFKEVDTLFKRHFENYGRHESTLIQSSQNLWVDGYKNLFPSKKVSIYVKGALCAMILDLTIRKSTDNKHALIDVVKKMYELHTFGQGGYTQEDVYDIILEIGGDSLSPLLHILYETTESLDAHLSVALKHVGCYLESKHHPDAMIGLLGVKLKDSFIEEIAPGSHVENYLSVGDQILSFNSSDVGEQLIIETSNDIAIKRGARKLNINIPYSNERYYETYRIRVDSGATTEQMENLNRWLGNNQK